MTVNLNYKMRYIILFVLSLMSAISASSMPNEINSISCSMSVDDEYQQFRKQGDDLFKTGQYDKALNKYLSCLEVPGFERDVYAITQVKVCKKAIELKREVMQNLDKSLDVLGTSSGMKNGIIKDSLFISQLEVGFSSFQALLKLNPDDASMRELAFTYWSAKGNQAMNKRNWEEAKGYFERALSYKFDGNIDKKLARSNKMSAEASSLSKSELQSNENKMIQESTPQGDVKGVDRNKEDGDDLYTGEKQKSLSGKTSSESDLKNLKGEVDGGVIRPPFLKVPPAKTSSKLTPLKIGLGGVAAIGFTTALSLNGGWNERLNRLDFAQNNSGLTQYLDAYQEAENYRKKVGIRNLSVTAAILALGVDTFLLVRTLKPSKVSVRTEGVGVNIQVRF